MDEQVASVWRLAGVQPAELIDDARFSRRVHLLLTGLPPTRFQQRDFLDDRSQDKRRQLIDRLLASPECAKQWATVWSKWLREDRWVQYSDGDLEQVVRTPRHPKSRERFEASLARSLQRNEPIDEILCDIVSATGNSAENGSAVFYEVHSSADDMARAFARSMLGVNISCARCHDHPHAAWDTTDFANLASCFTDLTVECCMDGTRVRANTGLIVEKRHRSVSTATERSAEPESNFKAMLRLAAASDDPRKVLAVWLKQGGREMLARNVVNRYWTQLFGRPLAGPPDDRHEAKHSSHTELFDALTRDFLSHDCDVQHLLRTICNSRLFQLDAKARVGSENDRVLFSRFRARKFSDDALLRVIEVVTETRLDRNHAPGRRSFPLLVEDPIKCSRDFYRSTSNGLISYIYMGTTNNIFNDFLKQEDGLPYRWSKSGGTILSMADELYFAILGRYPTHEERKKLREYFRGKERNERVDDLVWALLNSREFLFIH